MTTITADTPSETVSGNTLDRPSVMIPLLGRWATQHAGPDAGVKGVRRLPGHSGTTYAFSVHVGTTTPRRLVIKVPPLGVRQRDNTDVLRQVPLLRELRRAGVRAPGVVDSGTPNDGPFPVPYLIVEHMPGRMPGDIFTGPLDVEPSQVHRVFDDGLAELAVIHAVPWESALQNWASVRTARDEVDHWLPVLRKGDDDTWVRRGLEVRDILLAALPPSTVTGLVHGDFYSNNWLVESGSLTAVLDWEAASLGPQSLDVGWLCMMHDPASWGPTRRAWMDESPAPSPEWILDRYELHSGRDVLAPGWFRALAGYRLACLTAYYLRLHRTGRRRDPTWEVFGEAFPFLLNRAAELLHQENGATDV